MNKWDWLIAASLFLIAIFFYTLYLDRISSGFHGDEAELTLFSLKILQHKAGGIIGVGQHNHPIASFLPQVVTLRLLGENIFAARFPSAFFGALAVPLFYFFLRYLFNTQIALFSTILFMTSHLWIAMSRLAINNNQVVFFEILAFYFLFLALTKKHLRYFLLLGLSCGLMFYLYAGSRIVPIIVATVLLRQFLLVEKKRQFLLQASMAALAFLLVSLPQIIFFLRNPATFSRRAESIFIFSDSGEASQWRIRNFPDKNKLEILAGQISQTLMISPKAHDTSGQYGFPRKVLDPLTFALVILGLIISLRSIAQAKYLFLLSWLFLTLLAGNILMINPFFLPRATGALPVIFIFSGLGLNALFQFLKKCLDQRLLLPALITGFLLVAITVLNLKFYFWDSEEKMFGDPNKYAATKIASYLNSYPSAEAIFLTAPFLYSDFGSIRFLSPQAKTRNIAKPLTFIPSRVSRETLFIIYPAYKNKISDIIRANPQGELIEEKNPQRQTQFSLYKVSP